MRGSCDEANSCGCERGLLTLSDGSLLQHTLRSQCVRASLPCNTGAHDAHPASMLFLYPTIMLPEVCHGVARQALEAPRQFAEAIEGQIDSMAACIHYMCTRREDAITASLHDQHSRSAARSWRLQLQCSFTLSKARLARAHSTTAATVTTAPATSTATSFFTGSLRYSCT